MPPQEPTNGNSKVAKLRQASVRFVVTTHGTSCAALDCVAGREIPRPGHLATLKEYSAACRSLGCQRRWLEAVALLFQARRRLLELNVLVCGATSSAAERAERWEWAAQIVSTMHVWSVEVDLVAFTVAARASAISRSWIRAVALLAVLPAKHVEPGVGSSTVGVAALGQGGMWQAAWHMLAGMALGLIEASVAAHCAAIAGSVGRVWGVLGFLFKDFRKSQLQRNVVVDNSAVSACVLAHQWRQSLSFQCALPAEACAPDIITYNVAATASLENYRWSEGLGLARTARAQDLVPNVITYGTIVGALGYGQQWRSALCVLCGMRPLLVEPNAMVQGAMANACEKGHSWEWPLASLAWSSSHSCSAIVSASGRAGEWRSATRLVQELRRRGLEAELISSSAALSAYERSCRWCQVLCGLEAMRDAALQPSDISCSAVAAACEAAGHWSQVLHVLADTQARATRPHSTCHKYVARSSGCGGSWRVAAAALGLLLRRPLPGCKVVNEVRSAAVWAHEVSGQPVPPGALDAALHHIPRSAHPT